MALLDGDEGRMGGCFVVVGAVRQKNCRGVGGGQEDDADERVKRDEGEQEGRKRVKEEEQQHDEKESEEERGGGGEDGGEHGQSHRAVVVGIRTHICFVFCWNKEFSLCNTDPHFDTRTRAEYIHTCACLQMGVAQL